MKNLILKMTLFILATLTITQMSFAQSVNPGEDPNDAKGEASGPGGTEGGLGDCYTAIKPACVHCCLKTLQISLVALNNKRVKLLGAGAALAPDDGHQ